MRLLPSSLLRFWQKRISVLIYSNFRGQSLFYRMEQRIFVENKIDSYAHQMKRLFLYFFLVLALCLFFCDGTDGRKVETVQHEPVSLTITVSGTTIRVQNATPGSTMEVYDILGVKITSVRIDTADKTVTLNLPKGYYIFKVGDTVRKVVIK